MKRTTQHTKGSPEVRKGKTKLEKLRAEIAKEKKKAAATDVVKQTNADQRAERLKLKKYVPKLDEVENASREEVELREFFSELANERATAIAEDIDIFVDRPYKAPLVESRYEDLEMLDKKELRKIAKKDGLPAEGMKRDIIREIQKHDKYAIAKYDDLMKLSKDELSDMCLEFGLPIAGSKADMVRRLIVGEKAPWSRKHFFDRLNKMPPQMIITFAKAYISQDALSAESYLNMYLADDDIQKQITKLRGKMWLDELEEENEEFAGQQRQQKLDALAKRIFEEEEEGLGNAINIDEEIYGQGELNELIKPRKGREKGRRSHRNTSRRSGEGRRSHRKTSRRSGEDRSHRKTSRRSGKKTREEIAADVEATKARVNAMIQAKGKRKTIMIAGEADDVPPGDIMQTMFGEKNNVRDKWALDRVDRAGLTGVYPGEEIPIPVKPRVHYGTRATAECRALFRRAPWISGDMNGEHGYGAVENVYIAPAKPDDISSIIPYVAWDPIPELAAKTRLETAMKRQAALDPSGKDYIEDRPSNITDEVMETLPEGVQERLREKQEAYEKRKNKDHGVEYFEAIEEVEAANEAMDTIKIHPVTIEENGIKWYKAGTEYFDLVCQDARWKSKTQFGNILTIAVIVPSEDDSKILTTENLRIRVGYQTATGFIEQTEKIWQREVKYMRHEKAERTEKLAQYLAEPVTTDAEIVGKNMLERALSKIAPDNPNYKRDSKYLDIVVKKAAQDSSSVQEFAEKIAGIVVYIDISNIAEKEHVPNAKAAKHSPSSPSSPSSSFLPHPDVGNAHSIFAKRLAGNYYLPEVLATLSPGEKNPEVFDDPRVPSSVRDRAANNIRFHEEMAVREFSMDMYSLRTGERARPVDKVTMEDVIVDIDPWRNTCVNAKEVENVPDIDLLYYREGEHLYCLIIPELMKRFSQGNYTNPVSRQPLDDDFIFRFHEMYRPASPKVVARSGDKKVIGPQGAPLAKGLLRLMKECIAEKEAYMYGEEIDSSSESDEYKSASSDDPEDLVVSSSSGDESYESIKSSNESSNESMYSSSDEDENGNEGKSCTKCRAKLRGRGQFKSIAHDDNGVHVWHFCSRSCCESQKWPKRKRRKTQSIEAH